ncbi:MAG: hypothetical protein UX17_C0008G0002 [Parcubacteria group bacterium GW2011_GWC2_45_7]|nr:MAG: hypothetical protein UX17_C0008G0002 [Parcubacteria group bacterium GW2011_GWC2_45_7]KKU73349.1 MAG: hypothetical protein UX98_C0008G0015 [Parcubacteria group bacterium GW2011_GWA2_47_26]
MNNKKILGAGLVVGLLFYVISLLIWGLSKFLPVVPLAIAIPNTALLPGWQIEHLLVSLFIGIMWAIGFAVYGVKRDSGWLYGVIVYLVGTLPAFAVYFITTAQWRPIILYGALVSFIGALLGGKVMSILTARR